MGLPEQLSLDHDTVFYDSQSPAPYPTRLHLWLVALGIAVRFIQHPPPAEHSGVERMHQVMTQQALAGQRFAHRWEVQVQLDTRRRFLNYHYPTGGPRGAASLQRHPEFQHSGRDYSPEREESLLQLSRLYTYLTAQHWYRRVSGQGQITLGGYRYGLGHSWRGQDVELTFAAETQEFSCYAADGQLLKRLPAKGLTKADLMGELPPVATLSGLPAALALVSSSVP